MSGVGLGEGEGGKRGVWGDAAPPRDKKHLVLNMRTLEGLREEGI